MSFAFEQVAAKLEPFDMADKIKSAKGNLTKNSITNLYNTSTSNNGSNSSTRNQNSKSSSEALSPILNTGGLVFPYNPSISEGVSVNYDKIDLTHSNESYYSYNNTENVRITLSECTWTADTFENAIYTLSVIHFLRAYSMMDFGMGRSGRPPSPMWFSAYGNYLYHRVPVLLEKADWNFPKDKDYVGIPEFGSQEYQSQSLTFSTKPKGGNYTWLPIQFEVGSISLLVQHSPKFWVNWNLDDFKSGKMLTRNGSFHSVNNPSNNSNSVTNFGV